jgi:hypothetical protein
MKTQIILLRIAGVICILFTAFHFAFNKLFQWDTALSCMKHSDWAILLTYHYISILLLGFMAFVSLVQTKVLIASKMKYSVLGLFTLFYALRIVTEFTLFGLSPASPVILLMCFIPIVLFTVPMFMNVE